ncbi:MAG: proprotein convertase P-domain-containing protein [Saprospiraceae bacterium]
MKVILLTFSALLVNIAMFAQSQHPIWQLSNLPLQNIERLQMPLLDNEALKNAELQRLNSTREKKVIFAHNFEVNYSITNSGTWFVNHDNSRVWRIILSSPNAKSLNLGFTKFKLDVNDKLFIYSMDKKHVMGPFTPADNEVHEQLWTPIIESDEIVVELQTGRNTNPELEIGFVNHDYMGFYSINALVSGSCNLDVICGAADGWPENDNYRDIMRSVAVIGTSGSTFCSGFLVTNALQDCKPYFMTANHCGITSANAASFVAYWKYENSTCRLPNTAESGSAGDGSLATFNTGAIFRATRTNSDFTLIELDDPVNTNANAFFAGWDATSAVASSTLGIHHPSTDEKRISYDGGAPTLGDFGYGTLNSHWQVNWARINHAGITNATRPITEGGSSGSPLFNATTKRVIGQLHGGASSCASTTDTDEYGAFSMSWNVGTTAATRLYDWLGTSSTPIAMDGKNATACLVAVIASPTTSSICTSSSGTINLSLGSGFTSNPTLTTTGLPSGLTASYFPNPATSGGTSVMTVNAGGSVATGTYNVTITATAGAEVATTSIAVTVSNAISGTTTLASPSNTATNVSSTAALSWSAVANATSYLIQIATDNAFTNIVQTGTSSTTNYNVSPALNATTQYYWRVIPTNGCGNGATSSAFSFTTATILCQTFMATNVPQTISTSGTPTVTSVLNIPTSGTITDINVVNLTGTHTWISDLTITLTSPGGVTRTLLDRVCSNQDNFNIAFDDEATNAYSAIPCPPTSGLNYIPNQTLSAFDAAAMQGNWTLTVVDNADQDGGALSTWGLEICYQPIASFDANLNSIIATPRKNLIEVNWQTIAEDGLLYYEVEKSSARQHDFTFLKKVMAQGKNGAGATYQITDTDVKIGEEYYYRLKMFNNNGSHEYSKVVSAKIDNPDFGIFVQPNPTQQNIYFTVQHANIEDPATIYLYDVTGKEVLMQTIELLNNTRYEIEMQHLPKGIYLLKLSNSSQQSITKVVKQ